MTIRSILVPILPGDEPAPQLNAALQIARRFEGRLTALFIRPDPADTIAAIPNFALVARISLADVEQAGRDAARTAHDRFDGWRAACAVIGEPPFATGVEVPTDWIERAGPVEMELAEHGRLSDLIVAHYPTRHAHGSDRVFATAVFSTGRPVLLVRHAIPKDMLNHVLIAWNGSLDAARAVAAAMPFLRAAKQVTVLTADLVDGEPEVGLPLCETLAHHGINSEQTWSHRTDTGVGAAVLRAASERGASLIVMGTHNRNGILETLLGGATRHLLREGSLPILMAH